MRRATPLRFVDYIRQLPSAVVFENLLKPGSKRRILSSSLVDKIQSEYATAESTAARFKSLSQEAKRACALAYLAGDGGLAASGLEALRSELLLGFLVYEACDGGDARYFVGFEDIEKSLRPALLDTILESARTVADTGKTAPPHAGLFLNDFAVVCSLASQGLIRTTQTGSLTRLCSTALKRLLHGLPSGCVFQSKDADLKSIMHLLLDYGVERKVLVREGDAYWTSRERFERWSAISPRRRRDDFAEYALTASGGWRRDVLTELLGRLGTKWLSLSLFPEPSQAAVCTALRSLCYAEVLTSGRKGEDIMWQGYAASQSAASPSPDAPRAPAMVLPDFSALLPQEAAPEMLFSFSLVGTFSSLDRVYKAGVNRDIVNNSLSRGIDGEELLSLLGGWNAPENVRETVREWIREFSRLYMSAETIIVSCDEKTSNQLNSYGPIREMIKPLAGVHTVFTVQKGCEKLAGEILSTMGFDPRVPHALAEKHGAETVLGEPEREEGLRPVLEFDTIGQQTTRAIRSGKYSSELKQLETNEVYHVIEYAILMGQRLKIDYAGAESTRKGLYTIVPLSVRRGKNSGLEAEVSSSRRKRTFEVKKILRIGVESHGTAS